MVRPGRPPLWSTALTTLRKPGRPISDTDNYSPIQKHA